MPVVDKDRLVKKTMEEDRLKALGDPSGKQTSDYWDEWFKIVCGDNHRHFEWYCEVEEVVRMLKFHMEGKSKSQDGGGIIHPGSGNSLVPVRLRDDFGFQNPQVVVDISSFAIEEMKRYHDLNAVNEETGTRYLLGNVLEPPLSLEDSSFDAWIDKGLIDALFHDSLENSSSQSERLFTEAYRLLNPDGGILMIITMAEEHSLQLILKSFWLQISSSAASLHIWELEPTSGNMLPFGFVLQRTQVVQDEAITLRWHSLRENQSEEFFIPHRTFQSLYESVLIHCDQSRRLFKPRSVCSSDRTMATIDIKPVDADVDLEVLKQEIMRYQWEATSHDNEARPLNVIWLEQKCRIVPIGFGVSKLVLVCIVDSVDLDNLIDQISEYNNNPFFHDSIQSVDVDWDCTCKVVDTHQLKLQS
jgi:translation elongation factor EF-1beta